MGRVCTLQSKCFPGEKKKKRAENKQIHHLQCVFPKKKFVLQPENRTTCELKELLHNANTNELLSPPRAEPRGTGRGGEHLLCLKKIRADSPAVC